MLWRLWSLLRLLFVWKIRPKDSGGEPDCIIMLAFGQELRQVPFAPGLVADAVFPGPANERIARVVAFSEQYPYQHPPILGQWEYAGTDVAKRRHLDLELTLGAKGLYNNTRQILIQAEMYMAKKGWKTAIIVGHPWHLPRCIWTAERLGIRVVHKRVLEDDLRRTANVWNTDIAVPDDQRQTTSLVHWLWYEFRARGYFWLKGWI